MRHWGSYVLVPAAALLLFGAACTSRDTPPEAGASVATGADWPGGPRSVTLVPGSDPAEDPGAPMPGSTVSPTLGGDAPTYGTLGAVDTEKGTVELQLPDKQSKTYKVRDPKFFQGYQPGEPVRIYTDDDEVLSVEPRVEPPPGGLPEVRSMELFAVLLALDREHGTVTIGPPAMGDVQGGVEKGLRFTVRDPKLFEGLQPGDPIELDIEGGIVRTVRKTSLRGPGPEPLPSTAGQTASPTPLTQPEP